MSKDERSETGRFTETVSPEDVLGVLDAVEGPVVTSGDVAEALDCSHETARRKLRTLEDDGRVGSRRTAGRVIWWRLQADAEAEIDPDDPFWQLEPARSGEDDVSESVDEVLYGES